MLASQKVTAFLEPVAGKNCLVSRPGNDQSGVVTGSQNQPATAARPSSALEGQSLRDFSDYLVFSSFHLHCSQGLLVGNLCSHRASSLASDIRTCPLVQGTVLPCLFLDHTNTGLTYAPYKT